VVDIGPRVCGACGRWVVSSEEGIVTKKRRGEILRLEYRPPGAYPLDLEIFSISDLRRRVDQAQLRSTYRYSFHTLLCVSEGMCTQLVDFQPICCEPGSLLVLRPGQTHRLGVEEDWDGWLILFRPEFLPPMPTSAPDLQLVVGLERLPSHMRLAASELRQVTDVLARMREDAAIEASPQDVHALLRYQLSALLVRLSILQGRQQVQGGSTARTSVLQRFQDFQQLVEKNFGRWHHVATYARHLGCAAKSLTRATAVVAGMDAKEFIVSRINLEAKRLLAHTDLSVSQIGDSLGFDEATNFVKFFKRETGCTPAGFRRLQDSRR
jgi:AraC-like DNA-binding protein